MILCKRFLCEALPDIKIRFGDQLLDNDSDVWLQLEKMGDIAVSIDSRTTKPGDFFIPLSGERADGHDFLEHVLRVGACGALIARSKYALVDLLPQALKKDRLFIFVDDVMQAFVRLAKTWRAQFKGAVVGITGSVGKTSTKEMLRSILYEAGVRSYVSYKNYNTLIGVCYNLLCAPGDTEIIVQEVGIDSKGEMREMADVLRPTIGVITCISHAHMQGLGKSLQDVAYEKRQLFSFFTPHDVGIVFGDQPLLADIHYAHPVAKFGLKIKNQVQARRLCFERDVDGRFITKFLLKWYGHKKFVTLETNHPGMSHNALAASSAAYFLAIPFEKVVAGLENYHGFENRFEQKNIKNGKGTLFSDCYNASPESMKAALLAFSKMESHGPKIAVLGDMLELGPRELYWHRQIGRMLSKVTDLDHLIVVGTRSKMIAKTAPVGLSIEHVDNWQQAKEKLEKKLEKESLVLVKASRAIALDKVVDDVTE